MIGGLIEMTSSLKTVCLSSVVPDLFKALALTKLATLTMAMTVRLCALTKLWNLTIMLIHHLASGTVLAKRHRPLHLTQCQVQFPCHISRLVLVKPGAPPSRDSS